MLFKENLQLFPKFDQEGAELRAEMDFGFIAGNTGTNTISDSVTFNTAFSAPPIFIAVIPFGSDASGTTWGSNTTARAALNASGSSPTTTGFDVRLYLASGNFPNTHNYFYCYLAIGAK